MPWKKINQVIEEESTMTRRGDMPSELFTALKAKKQLLKAMRNVKVLQRKSDLFSSTLPQEHIWTYLDSAGKMEAAHAEWEKSFEDSKDPTNSQSQLWDDTVIF